MKFQVTKDNKGNNQFGLGIDAAPSAPTAAQMSDESAVMQSKIAVTAMQVAYDQRPPAQEWLKIRLKAYLISKGKTMKRCLLVLLLGLDWRLVMTMIMMTKPRLKNLH